MKKLIIISFAVLLFLLLIFAVYLFSQNKTPLLKEQNQLNQTFDNTKDWKTFTNKKYGFEIKYPASYQISHQAKDDESIAFNVGDQAKFEILSWPSRPGREKQEQGHEPQGQVDLGGISANKFIIGEGICDGPDLCSPPVVAIEAKRENNLYVIIFYNLKELSAIENQIIKSFKFLK